MAAWSNAYDEFESGLLSIEHVDQTNIAYLRFLMTPGGQEWWATYRTTYPPSFAAYVDAHIETAAHKQRATSGEAAAQQGVEPDAE